MTSEFQNITVDCADARSLATFWAAVLGWNVYYDDDPEVLVAPAYPPERGPGMLFIPVPEGKSAKNRMHLDIAPVVGTRDDEVRRVIDLGARLVEDHREADGTGWAYLADPEGNEFCVVRGSAERGGSGGRTFRLDEQ